MTRIPNWLWRTPTIEHFLMVVVLLLLISFGARTCLFEFYQIPTDSMAPNYNKGEYIFVWRAPYILQLITGSHWPKLGQVILHRMPEDPNQVSIKRVLGLPGNLVAVDSQQVYWNEQQLDFEPHNSPGFKYDSNTYDLGFEHFPRKLAQPYLILLKKIAEGEVPVKVGQQFVPAEKLFLLGDNRSQSYDSRQFGFLDHSLVIGEVLAKGKTWTEVLQTLF